MPSSTTADPREVTLYPNIVQLQRGVCAENECPCYEKQEIQTSSSRQELLPSPEQCVHGTGSVAGSCAKYQCPCDDIAAARSLTSGLSGTRAAMCNDTCHITKCICQICKCGRHFCGHLARKSRYVKPEGKMDGETEYKNKFVGEKTAPTKSMKPKEIYCRSNVPLGSDTTYKTDFHPKHSKRAQSCKLPEIYREPDIPLDSTTSYKNDFIRKRMKPPPSFKPILEYLRPDVPISGKSVYKDTYRDHGAGLRPGAIRPLDNDIGLKDGPFQGETTYKKDYDGSRRGKPARAIRPARRGVGEGNMEFDTEYKDSYTARPFRRCPAQLIQPVYQEGDTPWLPKYNLGAHTYFTTDRCAAASPRQMSEHNINDDYTPWKEATNKPRVIHDSLPIEI